VEGYPIAVRLARQYAARNSVGYTAEDLLSIAHEALTLGTVTFDESQKLAWEVYIWHRIRGTIKNAIRKRAKELGLSWVEDAQTPEGRLLCEAVKGLEDYGLAVQDPGDFYHDTPEDAERQFGDLRDGAGAALGAGVAGASWYMRGEEGFGLREEYVRAHAHLWEEGHSLSAEHATIFEMRYFQVLKISDIVRETGFSKATVERRLVDAINELRDRLKARGTLSAPSPEGK
jgi:RNA polymerase sigma factor (sigma-70 family)